jgi:hypothetical protein
MSQKLMVELRGQVAITKLNSILWERDPQNKDSYLSCNSLKYNMQQKHGV